MKKFFRGIRGKQILVSVLAVMVIGAGYYQWATDGVDVMPVTSDALPEGSAEAGNSEQTVATDNDYFARARYERDCARSEAVELLTVSAINDESTAIDDKIQLYAKNAESEAVIENLVMAKGYDDCVAFVGDEGVSVVVKSPELTSDSVSKIKDIVVDRTGAKVTDIKISCKN